jgi:hypothetical protein
MAILINDNYRLSATKPFDDRYMNISTPWASCGEVLATITTYRHIGLTVNINGDEYWWKNGVSDNDLILKQLGGGTSNLSGATNGLGLFSGNTYVGLGGLLNQDTTICGAHTLNLGNVSSGLTALCVVTPTFHIQDKNNYSCINFLHDTTSPAFDVSLFGNISEGSAGIELDVDGTNGYFNVYSAPNINCYNAINIQTTDDDVASHIIHSRNSNFIYNKETWISTGNTLSCEEIIDKYDSNNNIKSIIDYSGRCFNYNINNNNILSILSGGTARYGSNVIINNDCDLVHKYYVDNSYSSANGICKSGNNLVLGGSLTGQTNISGSMSCSLGFSHVNSGDSACIKFNGTGVIDLKVFSGTNFTCSETGLQIGCELVRMFTNTPEGVQSIRLGNDCMQVFDTNNSQGFVNAGDYESNFINRSLITKQYLQSQISGITGAITSVANGLTLNDKTVVLGGNLTGNTSIGGNLNDFDLSFNEIKTISTTALSANTTTTSYIINDGLNNAIIITQSSKILSDATSNSGFEYGGDYSINSKSNPRWIPDNAYVTGLTSQSITGATNGLTKAGQNVSLGGVLTGNTNICGNGLYCLNILNSGSSYNTIAEFKPNSINLSLTNLNSPNQSSNIVLNNSCTSIYNGFSNCYSCLNMNASKLDIMFCGDVTNASFTVTDNTTIKRGIEYAADYSQSFSDCSLITKKYVCSQISGLTSAATVANNGIVLVNNVVSLGGSLTGNTTIDGNNYNLILDTLSGFTVSADTINLNGSVNLTNVASASTTNTLLIIENNEVKNVNLSSLVNNGLSVNGNYIGLGGLLSGDTTICGNSKILSLGNSSSKLNSFNVIADSSNYSGGSFGITLDNTNAIFYDNSISNDGIKYSTCISTGFTNTCSLVDKGYVDAKVDNDSNTVYVNNTITNYTATQNDDFIGVSGASIINLPNNPKVNQRIIVTDICGNAFADSISIVGNGMCINGNSQATIDTDYGSITFINNGFSWSAIAFIN